ncbi:MAG: hypothetical protein JO187_07945, partial [Acidobacteria bacterium]|nr:hypothetical protein [Acidobacteriota bacterium]
MSRLANCALLLVLLASALSAQQQAGDASEVWSLEQAYWKYVQTNDLDS